MFQSAIDTLLRLRPLRIKSVDSLTTRAQKMYGLVDVTPLRQIEHFLASDVLPNSDPTDVELALCCLDDNGRITVVDLAISACAKKQQLVIDALSFAQLAALLRSALDLAWTLLSAENCSLTEFLDALHTKSYAPERSAQQEFDRLYAPACVFASAVAGVELRRFEAGERQNQLHLRRF